MAVSDKLRLWKSDLIDMSRTNRLIYHNATGRGAGIQFLTDADMYYQRLLHARRPLVIKPSETNLDEVECLRRLRRMRDRAREALNDRGTHVLYLAFGILEWKEQEAASEIVRSPVLLVPVMIRREGIVGEFSLERMPEEEPAINPTLRERLRLDFDLTLPEFTDIDPEREDAPPSAVEKAQASVTSICDAISAAIPARLGWRIVPEVHLGIFTFQKLVMYQDLARHEREAEEHPVLQMLTGISDAVPDRVETVRADELDDKVHPRDVLEILDADSSQQEAIVAAKAGESFVLQGPPGTGKSQTIANIIAELLGMNRRVLFVSEKMAALEVVQQRLRDAGLGEFLLDLHSHNADKKTVIAELRNALDVLFEGHPPDARERDWEREAGQLKQSRDQLNEYVRLLHTPRGNMNISAFEAYGILALNAHVRASEASLGDVSTITPEQFAAMKDALDGLLAWRDVLDNYERHPWREVLIETPSLELQGTIRARYTGLVDAATQLDNASSALAVALGETGMATTFGWMERALARAELASESAGPPVHWFEREAFARARALLDESARRATERTAAVTRLSPFYRISLADEDLDALETALTEKSSWLMQRLRAEDVTPQDLAMRERTALTRDLATARETLDALVTSAGRVAEFCGLETPADLRGLPALATQASCILCSPAPPGDWLHPKRFALAQATAVDAADKYSKCLKRRQVLEAIYTPAFFELDLKGIGERFRQQYGSVVRLVLPEFYRDRKLLSATLQPGVTRSLSEMTADLTLAEHLLADEQVLEDLRVEHARALGRLFNAAQTDWRAVQEALDWTREFFAVFPPQTRSERVVALVTDSSAERDRLQAPLTQLVDLAHQWEAASASVYRWLNPRAIAETHLTFDDMPPALLSETLARLAAELDDFLHAIDIVTAHRVQSGAPTDDVPAWTGMKAALSFARQIRDHNLWLAAHAEDLRGELDVFGTGQQTDWTAVRAALDWTASFLALYSDEDIPLPLREALAHPVDRSLLARIQEMRGQVARGIEAVSQELRYSDRTILPGHAFLAGRAMSTVTAAEIASRGRYYIDHLGDLDRWLHYRHQREECSRLGLDAFVDEMMHVKPFPADIVAIFEQRFYQIWLDGVLSEVPALERFQGSAHQRVVDRFRALDTGRHAHARRRIQALLHTRRHAVFSEVDGADLTLARSLNLLKSEVYKKRHRSIRYIVQRTAPAMLMLKPCWMMSPLSVSQFVESAEHMFDAVIFDEASQVCPEDAICAILRARQVIVVGDSKQLPPTRFFDKVIDEDDEDEEWMDDERTGRSESILQEFAGSGYRSRMLQWHYRSRHESLIAFSNAHFYQGRLHTFPTPLAAHGEGLRLEYVENGLYERGKTRRNRPEAERVVDLILEHVQRRPGQSLGVVALSMAQQSAIADALEARFMRYPELRVFEQALWEDDAGGFFVKNLESVQGDERDVIILSTGYGRDETGKVAQNFGPVIRKGGERRLNVAVTRARRQLILVTSLRASDIRGDNLSDGARVLRDYLEFAEAGPAVLARQTVAAPSSLASAEPTFESPFEEAVYGALRARGLALDTQVGCSGYRIDLAVRHPDYAGRYLLGIECDGATYHRSKTARDRDRLRQQHLESLGWRVHRIWSRDWVRDQAAEINKVLAAVEEARRQVIHAQAQQELAEIHAQRDLAASEDA